MKTVGTGYREASVWGVESVDNAKGKAINQTAADILGHWRPCLRKLNHTGDCGVDFLGKLQTETRTAFFIVGDGLVELGLCFFVEVELHFPCFARIFANTSSPGMSFASPASSCAMRRSASSAHIRVMSLSIGRLRLVSSFSMRIKRASAGKERASSVTRSVTGDTRYLPTKLL